jgi:hypothetical protein
MSGSAGDGAAGSEGPFYRQDRLLVQGLDGEALTKFAGLGFAVVARTRGLINSPVLALSIPTRHATRQGEARHRAFSCRAGCNLPAGRE